MIFTVRKILYITGNKFKVLTASKILKPLGFHIEAKKLDCPEIQADTIEEVAKYSSKYASDLLKESTLKNDSGLIIPALNNFPSMYSKYIENTIGEEGILKLMSNIKDREAYFLEVLAYTEEGEEPVTFISRTEGYIASEASGKYGWGYDRIFVPKGEQLTLANFDDDVRWKFWKEDAYKNLAEYLSGDGINLSNT